MEIKVKVNNQEQAIKIVRQGETLQVTIGDRTLAARRLRQNGPSAVWLYEHPQENGHMERRLIRLAGHRQGQKRQLWVNGQLLAYERLAEENAGTAAMTDAAAALSATIPAVVTELLAQPGDEVTAGQKLLLLESMKMVIPIQAPRDGVVAAIHCQAGDAVQPGVPLLELEETA